MNIDKNDTAVVFIDPQNEVLSERGLAWPLVHESLQENHTIENMERIFKAAKARGFEVFISPHYFYPTDKGWKFNGPLETDEATSGMFARKGVLNLDGLEGSGADWLERFKPYIQDGKTIVVAPHRVWGPESNDLVLTAPQTQDRQDHSRWNASQHVRRISLARVAGTGVRGGRRERCDGRAEASGMGLRLHSGAYQLCVSCARGVDHGRSSQGDGPFIRA
jgi:nicotinamidase-related amidase